MARRLGLDLGLELLLKSRLGLVSKIKFGDKLSRNFTFNVQKLRKLAGFGLILAENVIVFPTWINIYCRLSSPSQIANDEIV